jgi:Bacteriophage HK97-gp10, putative tail-component
MAVKVKIEGLDACLIKLKQFQKTIARKAIRKGLRAGAKYLSKIAKADAPKDTGDLAKAINVRAGKRKAGAIRINVVSGKASVIPQGVKYYGADVEYGLHPYRHLVADPFMKLAFKSGQRQAQGMIKAAIVSAIAKLGK